MNIKLLLATAAAAALLSSAPALALNPQPEPPGKNQVTARPATTNMMATGANGSAAMNDDTCGTPVPGHHPPHSNWGSMAMRTNSAARCSNMKTNTMQGGAMAH